MRGEHDIYYKLIANLCQYLLRIFFKKILCHFITDTLYVIKWQSSPMKQQPDGGQTPSGNKQQTTNNNQQTTINKQQSTTNNQQPTINNQQITNNK